MATHRPIFHTKVLPRIENDGTIGGESYSDYEIDKNVGRAFGGIYSSLSYTENDIAYWENAYISSSTYDGLNDSGWTESADVTGGTLPTNIKAVAVEYLDGDTVAAYNYVRLAVEASGGTGSTYQVELAKLQIGESIVIPISGSISASKVLIKSDYSHSLPSFYAKVNVMVAGV